MRGVWGVVVLVLVLSGCGAESAATDGGTRSCAIPPETYDDLAACNGSYEFLEAAFSGTVASASTAKIVVASKDPNDILGGLGAYMKVEGTTDSFVVRDPSLPPLPEPRRSLLERGRDV